MATMTEVLQVAGITRNAVNKLDSRGYLRQPLPPTTVGVARQVPRENALEICFLASAMRAGLTADEASFLTAEWLQEEASGKLGRFWAWNPKGSSGPHSGYTFSFNVNQSFEDLAGTLEDETPSGYAGDPRGPAQAASEIIVIDRRAIVERVDALYSK